MGVRRWFGWALVGLGLAGGLASLWAQEIVPALDEIIPALEEEAPPPPAVDKKKPGETAPETPASPPKPKKEVPHAQIERDTRQTGPVKAYVVPVEGPISEPMLFILRRAMKEAAASGANVVVLDMDTPGGRLDVTLEIMDLMAKFEGTTITYVNDEAISAGAIIASVTQEIYFAPRGRMGAAEVVSGSGEDIAESMKRKIDSYLQGTNRAYTQDGRLVNPRYRADVIRAMGDPDFVLEVDGQTLKGKGQLLTLTAYEANGIYGDPPEALLSLGTAETLEDLLNARYGAGNVTLQRMEITWSEDLASWIDSISPLLFGVGMMLIFMEFRIPSFGMMAIPGLVLLAIVFFGNQVAGLAGMEWFLVMLAGLALVAADLFFFPGTFVLGMVGLVMIAAAALFTFADVQPGQMPDFNLEASGTAIGVGLAGTVGGFLLATWLLPNTPLWRGLVLRGSVGVLDPVALAGGDPGLGKVVPPVGAKGVAVTDLRPLGSVEIKGERFEARATSGTIAKGTDVRVTAVVAYALEVEPAERA